MFERLQRMLGESFGIPPDRITSDTRIGDLLRDSLDLAELAMLCDEELRSTLPDEIAGRIDLARMTVGQLSDLLEHYRGEETG